MGNWDPWQVYARYMPATPIYFFTFSREHTFFYQLSGAESGSSTPGHRQETHRKCNKSHRKEPRMKGYNTPNGYMGFVDGRYLLFCTEGDYLDYVRDMLGELTIEPVIEARQAA